MAAGIVRRFIKRLFIVINSFVALLFLLSCLVPYLNPSTWWFMGFLGLMVPYLATLLLLSVFFWLVINGKYVYVGWNKTTKGFSFFFFTI